MANILDYLKNLFSSEKKPATEASLVGQLDASTTDELKFMMKNSKGFLPISLETNLGSCSRIYDDELYHSSTSKFSGLWLAGVFRDKEGQKVFDLPIEDFDAETQKAVMTATRETFLDAQKQKIIEGGLRVFGDPYYHWDSLLSENNLAKENYRWFPAICRDLESLAKIKDIKNYSAKFSVLKSLKGEFAGQYVLTGKYNHLPLRSNHSVSDEFIYAFNKDNPSDRKLLNNFLNAKRQGNFKDADATKLAVVELYYKNIEAKTKERISGIVTDGAGMVTREVNDFNRHHERQYMSAHQIPYMTVEYGVPTWHGDLDMTAYEHSSIKTLPKNLHITGSLILTNADKKCSLTALPDGLKADGGIKAPKEYLESLKTERQRNYETIINATLERVKKGSTKEAFTTEERSILLKDFLKAEEPCMFVEDPATGMSNADVIRSGNEEKIQGLIYAATQYNSHTDEYMAPDVDRKRVGDVYKELVGMTRISEADIQLVQPENEMEFEVKNILKQAEKNEVNLNEKIRIDLPCDSNANNFNRYESVSIDNDGRIRVGGIYSQTIYDSSGDGYGGEQPINTKFSDLNPEIQQQILNDVKKNLAKAPEKIIPTSVTVGELKNGKISYRDVVAVAATVKDGKVLFYESEKDAKKARNPHFFDALSLNDKKQLLDVLVDSKVSDDICISARESYLLHEADFKRSLEQYKKSEEQNQGKGVHR